MLHDERLLIAVRPPHPQRNHGGQRRQTLRRHVPFGGYKQSGVGREMGVLGFEEYLQAKSLAEPA